MTVTIENVKPHIGGIVRATKEDLLKDDVIKTIREALEQRSVLVFPQINLTDAEQLAFTDKLGSRVNFTTSAPGSNATSQDVYKITLDPKINTQPEYVLGSFFWHIDGATMDQPLPKFTLVSARKLAPRGGQTEIANTYAAYESLPAKVKAEIDGLKVTHTLEASLRPVQEEFSDEDRARWARKGNKTVHPLVWTHKSGRKSLVLGSHADTIVGMSLPEGRALLTWLTEWASQPDFTLRRQHDVGDLVVWDNCGSLHRAVPYDTNSGRVLHRTSVAGEDRIN